MSDPASQPPSRWTGLGEALQRMAIGAVGAAAGVGLIGAGIAWAAHRSVSTGVAGAYYLVGSALFLIGMFPSGGFSTFSGRLTKRRPTGSRQEPVFLLGLLLVGLGVIADLTRPF
jgi:hypothetical protein